LLAKKRDVRGVIQEVKNYKKKVGDKFTPLNIYCLLADAYPAH